MRDGSTAVFSRLHDGAGWRQGKSLPLGKVGLSQGGAGRCGARSSHGGLQW